MFIEAERCPDPQNLSPDLHAAAIMPVGQRDAEDPRLRAACRPLAHTPASRRSSSSVIERTPRNLLRTTVVCLSQLLFAASTYAAGPAATIVFDKSVPQFQFAASELTRGMQQAGFSVAEGSIARLAQVRTPLQIVITTANSPEAKSKRADLTSLPAEGFQIQRELANGTNRVWILGADPVGALYGSLEVAEWVRLNGSLDALKNVSKSPYIANRGFKFNIPLDARTPSYSDSGESGQLNIENMWDEAFWHEFIDQMARDRLNTLTLWSMHPFPSLVKVPEYPKVALNDVMKTTVVIPSDLKGNGYDHPSVLKNLQTVKKMSIEEKMQFWQRVMKYGSERGVGFYFITWNTFIYGTQDSGYKFTDSLKDANTADYFRKSVKAMIKTYPLLKGIGITAGENMGGAAVSDEKEEWLWKTYGQGINDALDEDKSRSFRLIHRGHQTSPQLIAKIFSALNPRCVFDYEYKYSQAHMYSSPKPMTIYSTKFLEETPVANKVWLTCRDDDYYMYRWADVDFMRSYVKNMPEAKKRIQGVLMGPDGYIWGRDYIGRESQKPAQLLIKKKWFSVMAFGRLSYDPDDLPSETVTKMVAKRYPEADAQALVAAWTKASRILPMVSQFHYQNSNQDFQWYPEACLQFPPVTKKTDDQFSLHTVDDFIKKEPQPGSNMVGIKEYVAKAGSGQKDAAVVTPPQVAETVHKWAEDALKILGTMPRNTGNRELNNLLGDIEAMSYLGHYYSSKISGALNKELFESTRKAEYQQQAITHMKEASRLWKIYAAKAHSLYQPQYLTRFLSKVDPKRVDLTKLQAEVDKDILLVGGRPE